MITLLKTNRETGKKSKRNVSLDEFLKLLKKNTKHVAELRKCVAGIVAGTKGAQLRYRFIDKIPRVYPSVTFRRQGKDLFPNGYYSGLVMLEVKPLTSSKEVELVKQQASVLPSTCLAFAGSSGRSVKIWVRCAGPDGSVPKDEDAVRSFHRTAVLTALQCYKTVVSYPVQAGNLTPTASCRMSMDENPYYAPEAQPLKIYEQSLTGVSEALQMHIPQPQQMDIAAELKAEPANKDLLYLLFTRALDEAVEKMDDWKAGDDPEKLLPVLIEACWQKRLPEEEVCHRLTLHFASFYRHNETAGTAMRQLVRSIYKQNNDQPEKTVNPVQEMMLAIDRFLKKKYDLRFNEMNGSVELRRKISTEDTFRPLTKRLQNTVAIEAMNASVPAWDRDIDRYLHSEYVPVYNPVEDYFFHLEKWDGIDRITELAERIPCEHPHFKLLFKRWLLSMVGHWIRPDKTFANSTVLVMTGGQGVGKSTFCRQLLPPELRFAYTDRLDFQSRREAERYLSRFLLINIDEYDQLSSKQQAFMKYLLSAPAVDGRRPYGATFEKQQRLASFIATSNVKEILKDPTGNRRYLCIEVKGKIKNDLPINYSQLYAQLLSEIRSGERIWFDSYEEGLIQEGNKAFEEPSVVLERFWHTFRIPEPGENYEEFSASALYDELASRTERNAWGMNYPVRLGRLLHRASVPSRHTRNGTVYQCVRRKDQGKSR